MIPLLILFALAVMTIMAFIHAHTKRLAHEDHLASNARVLAEFKRMSIHRPNHIIDRRHQ